MAGAGRFTHWSARRARVHNGYERVIGEARRAAQNVK
jgi:hypothetical protein